MRRAQYEAVVSATYPSWHKAAVQQHAAVRNAAAQRKLPPHVLLPEVLRPDTLLLQHADQPGCAVFLASARTL